MKTCLEEMRAQQCGRGNKSGVNRPIWRSYSLSGANDRISPLVPLHDVDSLTDWPLPKCCWSHHGLQTHGQTWNVWALTELMRTLKKFKFSWGWTIVHLFLQNLRCTHWRRIGSTGALFPWCTSKAKNKNWKLIGKLNVKLPFAKLPIISTLKMVLSHLYWHKA